MSVPMFEHCTAVVGIVMERKALPLKTSLYLFTNTSLQLDMFRKTRPYYTMGKAPASERITQIQAHYNVSLIIINTMYISNILKRLYYSVT